MKETNINVNISQTVAILIDGNNIERSLPALTKEPNPMLNFDVVIPSLLQGRGLSRLIYFREGREISAKLAERLQNLYFGSVVPCHKSADITLSIRATQIASKVDTIIIMSGDSDFVELVRHLKSEGVRVEIAAVDATTAAILKDEADHFTPITADAAFSLNSSSKNTSSKSKPEPKQEAKAPAAKAPAAKSNSRNSRSTRKPAAQSKAKASNQPAAKPTAKAAEKPAAKTTAQPAAKAQSKPASAPAEAKAEAKTPAKSTARKSSSRSRAGSGRKKAPAKAKEQE